MKITESQLRSIIKQELSKVLKEAYRPHNFEPQTMEDIDKIAQIVNNQACWNYNNRMYAIFVPAKFPERAKYWLRKPFAGQVETTPTKGYHPDLISMLYELKIINSPTPKDEEVKNLHKEALPVRDQFGNIN